MDNKFNPEDVEKYASIPNPRLVSASYISALFGKPPEWFSRDRVRKSLYAQGFPGPVVRGRWLRSAVDAWFERRGNLPHAQTSQRRRQMAFDSAD